MRSSQSTQASDEEEANRALVESREDADLQKAVRDFRTDCLSRAADFGGRWVRWARHIKARVLSEPYVIKMMTAAGRMSFLYDFSSDGLVAKAMSDTSNPIWCRIIVAIMLLPYLILVWALSSSAPRRLSDRTGLPVRLWQLLWLLFGGIICFGGDVVLTVMYLTSEPTSPMIYHFMTLRRMAELVEAILQCGFQGYIFLRQLNPADMFPEVQTVPVNPWLLGSSVLFSMHGAHGAWSKLSENAKYQTGGNKLRFLQKMMDFGEGLAPSHLFAHLRTRQSLTIEGNWKASSTELVNLGRTAQTSQVLEELQIRDAGWLAQVLETDRVYVQLAITGFMSAPALRHFELSGAAMPQWIEYAVREMAKRHPTLEEVQVEGVRESFPNEHLALVAKEPLLRATMASDPETLEGLPPQRQEVEALALSMAARSQDLATARALLLRPGNLQVLQTGVVRNTINVESPIFTSVCHVASPEMLQLLLLAKADPHAPDEFGSAPLYIAAENNSKEAVALLLEAGANPETEANNGANAVLIAAQNNSSEAVALLLEAGANPDTAANNGITPVWIAAETNSSEAVALLLKARANPETARKDGATPVWSAAQSNSKEAMALLLEAGANPETANDNGMTPVNIAAETNSSEAIAMLLKARANPETAKDDGATPVYIAAQNNSSEAMALLLKARANPETAKDDGATPVYIAAEKNSKEAMALLLKAGANPETATNNGATPVYIAAQNNSSEAMALLLKARANPDTAMNDGTTPVWIAAYCNSKEAMALLLQGRANPHTPWGTGETPVFAAAQKNSKEALELLLHAKGNPNTARNDGTTPLVMAAAKKSTEATALLLEARTAAQNEALPLLLQSRGNPKAQTE